MKVAVYIRVSTTEQAKEGYSIKAQKTRLQAFATSQDWDIVQYYVDEGISAKDMKRPELQRMLDGIKNKLFDCVLIYRLDRLTRSVVDLHSLLETFEKFDVKFKSATESYDTTTATGRLFITLVASMAQWERENLGERVSFGMEEKARQGKWALSTAPLGFDIVGDYLEINELEALIVREIFELYATGENGQNKLAGILNKKGYRSKAGALFTGPTVAYALSNPIYIGTMRYNYRIDTENYFEVEGVVLPLVDEHIYHRVQGIIQSRTSSHPRRATSPYIFSGVAKCKRCGSKLNGTRSTTTDRRGGTKSYVSYKYYCAAAIRGECTQKTISQSYFEIQFLKLVENWDLSEGIKTTTAAAKLKKTNQDKSISFKKELQDVKKRMEKWQFAWVGEIISDDEFKNRMDEERLKESGLQKKIAKTLESNPKRSELPKYLKEIKGNWHVLTTLEKKYIVTLAVKELQVDKVFTKRVPESLEISGVVFN
ncbi:recombinase family protein [Sporosarcina sp. FA9]|uniref:recombinase family protein n=1 Tax=Sporosarcina sp. FA9 TaxID=3413030 RepID=UPI003F65B2C6